MSFLYPLLWLGAMAIAAPIWLHLRRKDEANLVRFSAMRFLDDQPLARSRPMWPRDWPLLLLRIAALLLLVAAFAWPYFADHETHRITESRVYLLDNTLSNQAGGRFEADRERLARELANHPLDVQVAAIELGAVPRTLASFGDDPAAAAETVEKLEPGFQRGTYLTGFRSAAAMLEQSFGQRRRIVLLGDSQENQWQEGVQSPPFLAGIEVELPPVEAESRPNLALSEPAVQRLFLGDRVLAQCVARLSRFGRFDTAAVQVLANGRVVRDRLGIAFAKDADAEIVLAEFEIDPAQWLRGEIRLLDSPAENGTAAARPKDELAADDRVYFSLPPLREGRAALIGDSKYLRAALSPEIMRGRWRTTQFTPAEFQDRAPIAAAEVDAICVESTSLTAQRVRELVFDCLNAGKGVLLLVARDSPVVSGLLREFGIESRADQRAEGKSAEFRYVYVEHPIFQPFRSTDFGSLLDLRVHQYRRLKVAGATPLVFSRQGDPLVFESTNATGKLLVFAFGFDRDDTNWPLHPTFVPFLDKCLQYVRPAGDPEERSFEPGEAVVWPVRTDPPAAKLEFRAANADAARGPPLAAIEPADGLAKFPAPTKPGHYELRVAGADEILSVLNVNPPPPESELRYTKSPEALVAWRGSTADAASVARLAADAARSAAELSRGEILQQRVWWWLLLAAAAAVLAESVWVARRQAANGYTSHART